jgi:hypothetical protein
MALWKEFEKRKTSTIPARLSCKAIKRFNSLGSGYKIIDDRGDAKMCFHMGDINGNDHEWT